MKNAKNDKDGVPTLDEYFAAHHALVVLVRQAFDGSVSRKKLLAALKRCEKLEYKAL